MILFIMTVPLIFNNSLFVLYFETTKMLILRVCFISHSFNGQVFFQKNCLRVAGFLQSGALIVSCICKDAF